MKNMPAQVFVFLLMTAVFTYCLYGRAECCLWAVSPQVSAGPSL